MSISDIIFEQMKNKGLSQKEFSKITGIPESTISDWKKKGNTPKAEKLYDISHALGISLYELLGVDVMSFSNELDYKLSDSEIELIETFRQADIDCKKHIIAYVSDLMASIGKKSLIDQNASTDKEKYSQKACDTKEITDSKLIQQKQLARRLRRLARLDRLEIDDSEHNSGLNKHLFKYLDYLGIEKLEYVKHYLSTIQPFMLTEMKSQEKFDNAICVLDGYYRISLYIKVDATKGEVIVVSFHENN